MLGQGQNKGQKRSTEALEPNSFKYGLGSAQMPRKMKILVFPQHSPSILLVCSFSIPPVFLEYFPSIALVFL